MKARINHTAMACGTLAVLVATGAPVCRAADSGNAAVVQVENGTVSFDSPTNVSAISVHGKSSALKARVRLRQDGSGLVLEDLNAVLPIKTLNTGMGIRDEHMRKYVFTTPDGQVPDLKFSGDHVTCPGSQGHDMTCKVSGRLAIRGVERPFTISLKIRHDGSAGYRAAGDGTVKLSDYGIEPPSQLGVRSANDVKLHVEFTGKAATETASNGGAR